MRRRIRTAAIVPMTLAFAHLLTHDAQADPLGMLAALTVWCACGVWLLLPRLVRLLDGES